MIKRALSPAMKTAGMTDLLQSLKEGSFPIIELVFYFTPQGPAPHSLEPTAVTSASFTDSGN